VIYSLHEKFPWVYFEIIEDPENNEDFIEEIGLVFRRPIIFMLDTKKNAEFIERAEIALVFRLFNDRELIEKLIGKLQRGVYEKKIAENELAEMVKMKKYEKVEFEKKFHSLITDRCDYQASTMSKIIFALKRIYD
jgi:broad-specificity NMP kinase